MSNSLNRIRKIFTFLFVAAIVVASIVFVTGKKSSEWPRHEGDQAASSQLKTAKPSEPSPELSPEPSPEPSFTQTVAKLSPVPSPVVTQKPDPPNIISPTPVEVPVSPPVPLPQSPSIGYSDSISADSIPTITQNVEKLPGKGIGEEKMRIMLNKGQFAEIENTLETLIKANGKNAQAKKQLGILYFNMGLFDRAKENFRAALWEVSGNEKPIRELGLIYTITNPPEGAKYFTKILSGRAMEDKTAKAIAESFLTLQAFRIKNNKEIQLKYLKLSSAVINRILTYRVDRKENSSDLDLLNAGIFLMKGNTKDALRIYESVGLSQEAPGDTLDKIHGAFARCILYLNLGKLAEADRFIINANKLQKEYKDCDLSLILPRQEEMIFCEVVLFKKGLLVFHLKKMWDQRKENIEKGVASIENSDRLRKLLIEMEESRIEEKYDTSLKKADEILALLKKSGGYYFDLALVQPLFRSSLLIYIGDIYILKKMKGEAGKCYQKAIVNFPPVRAVVMERIKNNGI